MLVGNAREESRAAAHVYERGLLPDRRKRLGQFFTGLPLGRLLAHLALLPETRTVLDPMAGHGDLLDATWEAAIQRGIPLVRLDGVEVDAPTAEVCRRRLAHIAGIDPTPTRSTVAGDAFVPATMAALPQRTYDLVITNPPYVRYQVGSKNGAGGAAIRAGLSTTLAAVQSGEDAHVWRILAESYSGLADLSVPAWLLAAAMVRPGGRLALVVPATWRSRDYADVVRYLLLRCFELQCIVSDRQPGWFSDALVRTHLIVAQRLEAVDGARPLGQRTRWPTPPWVEIAPQAARESSLVGALAGSAQAEAEFAARLYSGSFSEAPGAGTSRFDLAHEAAAVEQRAARRRWFRKLEASTADLPLFADARTVAATTVPDVLADVLPRNIPAGALSNLADAGIAVGQGLRTGCNGFFYVTVRGPTSRGEILVEASPLFGRLRFAVPSAALRPALRRQVEVAEVEAGRVPDSRVESWTCEPGFSQRTWIRCMPRGISTAASANCSRRLCPLLLPAMCKRRRLRILAARAAAGPSPTCPRCVPMHVPRVVDVRRRGTGICFPILRRVICPRSSFRESIIRCPGLLQTLIHHCWSTRTSRRCGCPELAGPATLSRHS